MKKEVVIGIVLILVLAVVVSVYLYKPRVLYAPNLPITDTAELREICGEPSPEAANTRINVDTGEIVEKADCSRKGRLDVLCKWEKNPEYCDVYDEEGCNPDEKEWHLSGESQDCNYLTTTLKPSQEDWKSFRFRGLCAGAYSESNPSVLAAVFCDYYSNCITLEDCPVTAKGNQNPFCVANEENVIVPMCEFIPAYNKNFCIEVVKRCDSGEVCQEKVGGAVCVTQTATIPEGPPAPEGPGEEEWQEEPLRDEEPEDELV